MKLIPMEIDSARGAMHLSGTEISLQEVLRSFFGRGGT